MAAGGESVTANWQLSFLALISPVSHLQQLPVFGPSMITMKLFIPKSENRIFATQL